ncbi:hypothetical protein BH10PSE7_BH10PSE7_21340 [soil metagenome]
MKRISNEALKRGFLGWQCRIRQMAMRDFAGMPQPAMQPAVSTRKGEVLSARMTILLIPREPAESTAFLKFQPQRYRDPERALDAGLKYLAGEHYQIPEAFSDEMTAVFPPGSPLAAGIIAAKVVLLDFAQFSQTYRMFCKVRRIGPRDPAREASFAHNRVFNPNLPNDAVVLGFKPEWKSAAADPWP